MCVEAAFWVSAGFKRPCGAKVLKTGKPLHTRRRTNMLTCLCSQMCGYMCQNHGGVGEGKEDRKCGSLPSFHHHATIVSEGRMWEPVVPPNTTCREMRFWEEWKHTVKHQGTRETGPNVPWRILAAVLLVYVPEPNKAKVAARRCNYVLVHVSCVFLQLMVGMKQNSDKAVTTLPNHCLHCCVLHNTLLCVCWGRALLSASRWNNTSFWTKMHHGGILLCGPTWIFPFSSIPPTAFLSVCAHTHTQTHTHAHKLCSYFPRQILQLWLHADPAGSRIHFFPL